MQYLQFVGNPIGKYEEQWYVILVILTHQNVDLKLKQKKSLP